MRRSEINAILEQGEAFIRSFGYVLPPFAYYSVAEMAAAPVYRQRGLGWDITDYGQGRFEELGLFLFTVRNGPRADMGKQRGMHYAEKIMISRKNQLSPMHRHFQKTEDIINRGGSALVLELFAGAPNGSIDRTSDVTVPVDGTPRTLKAGGRLTLVPGESVTLYPGIWHAFWGEGDDVLVGEVSTVNDDKTDNEFEMDLGRFPKVDEDEPPLRLLVSDYETYGTRSVG